MPTSSAGAEVVSKRNGLMGWLFAHAFCSESLIKHSNKLYFIDRVFLVKNMLYCAVQRNKLGEKDVLGALSKGMLSLWSLFQPCLPGIVEESGERRRRRTWPFH